jgi:hypothetical protein
VEVELGTLSDFEGDPFSVTFSGLETFMTATYDASGNIKFILDEATAVNGNYTLSIAVKETVDGTDYIVEHSTTIEVKNYPDSSVGADYAALLLQ